MFPVIEKGKCVCMFASGPSVIIPFLYLLTKTFLHQFLITIHYFLPDRMDDMEKARESLIKEHYSDYERMLKRVLFPRNIPAWVYPKRKHTRRNEEHGESSRMMEEESCEIKPTVSDKIKTEQETTIRIKAEAEQSDINSEGEPSVKSEEELETPEKTVTEEALPKIKTEEKFAAKVKDEPDSPEE